MINFSSLSFKNILSVGNTPVTVSLDKTKTTLVHGTNGSGKSTILDALCYALFGKSFRGVNLGQLLNTQNKKALLVEVEFKIGKTEYLVRRGMKPKIFEIYKDGEQVDNKAADKDTQSHLENNILKLTYRSFTQIVILGSSNFIPFMQLNSAGRRECVEDFLDIKVFSTMSIMAKERLRGLKEQLRVLEAEMDAHAFKVEVQKEKVQDIVSRDDKEVEALQEKIKEHGQQLVRAEKELGECLEREEFIVKEMNALAGDKATSKARQLNTAIVKMNAKLEGLRKNVEFYEENQVCHTCNQVIAEEVKTSFIISAEEKMKEVDAASIQANEMLITEQRTIDLVAEHAQRLSQYKQETFEAQTAIKYCNRNISEAQKKIAEVQSDTASVDKEEGVLLEMERELVDLKNKKRVLTGDIQNHDIVTGLLKDSGIKTHIVRKYLPSMNKAIRYYLNELDLPIHFQLDSEFNEQVSSPLHQDFSYQSFSEGQKGRIDLALLFCWREIGRLKNSVSTNILFLDEVFSSSLDETGKECLLNLLRYKLPDNQRVIVVDHTLSGNFIEKFDRAIEVTRTSGFSRYD